MEKEKMKIGYIYHSVNCIDDKVYVGMTFNPKKKTGKT